LIKFSVKNQPLVLTYGYQIVNKTRNVLKL